MIRDKQEGKSENDKTLQFYGYRKLIAWQKADLLAKSVYFATAKFPKKELFGITSQLNRAALSVPANIVEGYARLSKNEFRRFLSISLGSLAETEYFLSFSYEQGLIKKKDYENIMLIKDECGRLIWKLHQSQK